MPRRFLYSLVGILIGLWIPISWLLVRAFSTRAAWWLKWLRSELNRNDAFYLVLAIIATTSLAVVGYLLGRRNDEIEDQSRTMTDLQETLHEEATTDGLTGLFNSRYIHRRLDVELEDAYQSPLSCLLVDVDHFKRINDKYGHPFGDEVLKAVAQVLKRVVRRIDAVGRLGGEEFIIVLPNTPEDRAIAVAERVREAVQSTLFSFEQKKIDVTVSVGVVCQSVQSLLTKEGMLKAVDEALYAAKRSGRNQVVLWKESDELKSAS